MTNSAHGAGSVDLPEPIHDDVKTEQIPARASPPGCDPGRPQVKLCVDYPLSLSGGAVVSATLTWSQPGASMYMVLWRGANVVTDAGSTVGRNDASMRAVADLSGDYVLQVQPTSGYIIDITFEELPGLATVGGSPPAFGPHVLLGIPDTGINPYHELYYRPHLTAHPCTYIRDFPCDIPELRLSVGVANYEEAVTRDADVWAAVQREQWYWIPQTVFVAVHCGAPDPYDEARGLGSVCILDEGDSGWSGHGTGTTSIAIMQNPDAYIAFHEGPAVAPFVKRALPVDVYSVSWGGGLEYTTTAGLTECLGLKVAPIILQGAGNDGRFVPTDCQKGPVHVIAVGGGYTSPAGHHALSANGADIEGYWSPPYANRYSVTDIHPAGKWGGTSFATPTAAGALGKVILEVRRASGYDGAVTAEGLVDPILGLTIAELREAMNRTASYTPTPKHAARPGNLGNSMVPLNPAAPWLQWGWGWYDGDVANATIAHLLGTKAAPEKPAAAVSYMEALYETRKTFYE